MAETIETEDGNEKDNRQDKKNKLTWAYMWQTSVFHGVSKINTAPSRILRILWLLALLGMCGTMIYQIVGLTKAYFSWHVKTTINLAFSPQVLPAITFCNTNPIRRSQVPTLDCALQTILNMDDDAISPECLNVTLLTSIFLEHLCKFYKDDIYCVGDHEDLDLFFWRRKKTQQLILMENREVIKKAGHQIEDLIISCNFGGVDCFRKNITEHFRQEWTLEYGNCYTMNTSFMRVFESGPPSGLDLIMDLQMDELLTSYKTGYGMRVVVHEQDTRPFPSSEGFTLGAGFETDFSLRVDHLTRLGGRYGNCQEDGEEFYRQTGYKYTNMACRMTCMENLEREECGCTDSLRRSATPSANAKVCTEDSEINCTRQINKDYFDAVDREESLCVCGNSCSELVYKVRSSSRLWPIRSYLPVLEETVCKHNFQTDEEIQNCTIYKANHALKERTSSYLRLRVYYETLNYQNIVQEPFYTAERFLSDIGGTIGLWIGASILGLGEGIELLFLAIFSFCRFIRGGQHSFRGKSSRNTAVSSYPTNATTPI